MNRAAKVLRFPRGDPVREVPHPAPPTAPPRRARPSLLGSILTRLGADGRVAVVARPTRPGPAPAPSPTTEEEAWRALRPPSAPLSPLGRRLLAARVAETTAGSTEEGRWR